MKQIKIFYSCDTPDSEVEKVVNAWIAENNINVVDVKFCSYSTPVGHECIEVMVIYKVTAHD